MEPSTTHTSAIIASGSAAWSTNAVRTASLVTKPSSGGIPAMDAAPIMATTNNMGAVRPTPESLRMSRVPAWWSMMPTLRNRVALNRPCAMTMPMPAIAVSAVPNATTAVMKPSWLTVPYARISLRSNWRSATQPPKIIVPRPRVSVTGNHHWVSTKPGASRATR